MELLIAAALLAGGFVVLVLGAEWLVRGASSIATRLGVSALVIGLTVVAFGTSMPELAVNLYSATSGATDVAIGNIIGSNIANILLILGISSLIAPLAIQTTTVRWELPFAFLAMVLVLVMGSDVALDGAASNALTRTDGLALIGLFGVFMFYIFAIATKGEPQPDATAPTLSVPAAVGLIAVGLAGLVLGGKLLVDNAVILARAVGLSEAVIGLTVVAVGTSLPELATSVVAAMRREIDIAVGNIVGSNIFNVFWILGLTASVVPLPATPSFAFDATVGILATLGLFLAVFVGQRGTIERWQGGVFVAAYVLYVGTLLTLA